MGTGGLERSDLGAVLASSGYFHKNTLNLMIGTIFHIPEAGKSKIRERADLVLGVSSLPGS